MNTLLIHIIQLPTSCQLPACVYSLDVYFIT